MSFGVSTKGKSFVDGASRVFLAPILPLLDDPTITEIMVNGPNDIFIERRGKLVKTEYKFPDDNSLMSAANIICQFVNKKLTNDSPRVDARLPDGSRVHIVAPPVSHTGVCLSIRRFPANPMSVDDLLKFGALNSTMRDFLKLCVEMHLNIVVAGGTGSGKTSLLNAIGRFIPSEERLLVIEDTLELQIEQAHTVRLEAQAADEKGRGAVPIRDLFHSALRMRPDRIVIGEVRGGEALDLVQAMTSGHSGALATVHATSPLDALRRLETLCLYADSGLPLHAVRTQVSSAMHMIVQTARLRDGSRKITGISEVLDLDEDDNYKVQPLFGFKFSGLDAEGMIQGSHHGYGVKPTFTEEALSQGFPIDQINFD
jgi:pilus assembly protein CpaF